ncbi:MAG: NAD(P)/FAD-dependent oxidoreductase, partial [Arenicellales bacterium]|nr:NAD(P)/FAD-dependent oxidoreductase [Arenicellales bacterium]
GQLTGGLAGLAKKRKVEVIEGTGEFLGPNQIRVTGINDQRVLRFAQAIIAVGSEPVRWPGLPEDPRIIDSTGALALADIPERLLVVGGGIIGLEMATVYQALGSRITVVEMMAQLMPGTDADLLRPLQRRLQKQCENLYLDTRVGAITATAAGLTVSFDGPKAPPTAKFDRVLLALGRVPNSHGVNAPAAGVKVDEYGFIPVDNQQRSNIPHIFAIGDLVGQPMLAHKASHQGKVAAEAAAGLDSVFAARVIPAVAYTDPEIAWVGLTETQAQATGAVFEKGVFPWAASGRALSLGRSEGLTKLLFDPQTHRLLGAGIVGPNAGDLIAEASLAIEMNCEARDLERTVHPHPTLSETVALAAEVFAGTVTDLYLPRK